ncbi:MAG: diaminopimelate decarboxylase, partial [Alkalimonas sp.]|nr:diaminopimelate decarboxylase [Alkalimonas sp.]
EMFAASQSRLASPCRIIMEPGRSLAANAGVLLCKVEYVKQGPKKRFLILDAAMNDLLRPSMYGAVHDVWPVLQSADRALTRYDVVGPICETGDTFSLGQLLPELQPGEAVALGQAGAYGAVMSSFYNTRPITPEVLVSGRQSALIRRRIEVDEQLTWDQMPDF